jgi:hypothetical protein
MGSGRDRIPTMTVNIRDFGSDDLGSDDLLATDDPPRPSLAILGLSLLPAAVVVILRVVGLL